MEKKSGNYYLGLDIGTGSVGWAVTDDKYHILRKKGKSLWGFRLFESAETAKDRRLFRSSRRRTQRKVNRIQLLQELFSEEITKIDPGFFLRLKESKYYPEDKKDKNGVTPTLPYSLFCDQDFTDKEYHKKFPTIFHLRNYLMNSDKKEDIRLIYLALHNIIKHRGHFLFDGSIDNISDFKNIFSSFLLSLNDELDINFSDEKTADVEKILKDKNNGISLKKKKLVALYGVTQKNEKAILGLISGAKEKLSDIFNDETLDDAEIQKICFSSDIFDDIEDKLVSILGEKLYLIRSAKSIYDWALLADILDGHKYISEAKITMYEKHKNDLKKLKKIVRDHFPDFYNDIFQAVKKGICNYALYVALTKKNGKKQQFEDSSCTKENFYKYIRDTLKFKEMKEKGIKDIIEIDSEMEKGSFMPKQVNKDNSVIPHQLHLIEMEKILEKAAKYYDFLNKRDESGINTVEKIKSIFSFRIPYYVGPLGKNQNNNFSWVVRNSDEKIYPWNFDKVVNKEKSAEVFITRMTNKCSYLIGEDVLPKNSILYSEFLVLNDLNNVRINGDPLPISLKKKIEIEVFKNKKVTMKTLRSFLEKEGKIDKDDEITGIDGDFKSSMKSFLELKNIINDDSFNNNDFENIVSDITLFGEDKKLLKSRLEKKFPKLEDKIIKKVLTLSYTGWGRLSKKLLLEVEGINNETGEVFNIINALRETNDNFMQLLSKKYTFLDKIEEINSDKQKNTDLNYQAVKDLYVSPPVKRQIWQTVEIVKELKKVLGKEPKKVFIEMAREEGEKVRTISRQKSLLALYNNCKKEEKELFESLEKTSDSQLRSDKLYLYYTQMGKCMYSGATINIEDLYNKNVYDIDHIFPQSKTTDNSLENRVLVKREFNRDKTDEYPLPKDWQNNMYNFWKMLYEKKFIGEKKFNRLTRTTAFTDDELSGFIARQLVETRQSTKAVADTLKRVFTNTEIVYVKAGNVSRFRQNFDLIKVRDLNDLHHGKDAYLNIVVGNVYNTKFTNNPINFIKNAPKRSYSLRKMYDFDVKRNESVAWESGKKGTIKTVKSVMSKNDLLFTRRSYERKGELFKQNIVKKGKGQMPIKDNKNDSRLSDIAKYGGYDRAAGSYFVLVKSYDKKGKEIKTIETIPLYLVKDLTDERKMISYLEKDYAFKESLKNPKILINKIKNDTLFKINGFLMHLSGRTGNRLIYKNAVQFYLEPQQENTIKKISNFITKLKINKNNKINEYDNLNNDALCEIYGLFCEKLEKSIYKNRPGMDYSIFRENKDKFAKELSIEKKCIVLNQILQLFACKSGDIDLTELVKKSRVGEIRTSKNITAFKNISIVYQSSTGLFEKEVDLLKL